jgi:Fic family protein
MSQPGDQEFQEKVGRGLVAALLFLHESRTRWPTLDDVRQIDRLIFNEADPTMAGEYRRDNYWPQYTQFAVPRWQDVPACMLRLEDLLRLAKRECEAAEGFERQEKILEWAARIHHRFECIHPFEDGNGRTGRALVSWMLSHYGLPDFEMLEDRRPQYLLALETADAALTTEDLLHADYWPHQTEALQPLIDIIGEVLEESV